VEGGSVSVAVQASIEERLTIAVSDTGPGIPVHKLDRLFNPFDRLDAEQTDIEGTGLGLALSKGLIKAMQGSIWAESNVGVGTTFFVSLARADSPTKNMENFGGPGRIGGDRRAWQSPDGALHRGTTCPISGWSKRFCNIVQTSSSSRLWTGGLGLIWSKIISPTSLLLDLDLPGMHGYQVSENAARRSGQH